MSEKDIKIAKELKKRLAKVVKILDFRVFGSRARGDADEYSDMDVFLEIPLINKELEDNIFDIVWEVSFKNCNFKPYFY